MKNLTKIFFAILFITQYFVEAQSIIKTDTINGNVLNISMDNRINAEIEKMEEYCDRLTYKKVDATTPRTTVKVPSRALTTAEICRKNPRISGFKIQIAVVKSNKEANEVKAYFRSKFPHIKVITDASLRPDYKILAGSYFTKETANSELRSIRQYFKSARAVQYSIFCAEGK